MGDSSVGTPADRDSVVMPISSVRSSGDSVDDTLDEQGTSFPRGRLMVPKLMYLKSGRPRGHPRVIHYL